MIYAVSDIHGCYDKYCKLLDTLALTDGDTLYILGDMVDRGEDGIDIIKDLMTRKNVVALRGNHDHVAMLMLKNFGMSGDGFNSDYLVEDFKLWLADGGMPTFEKFYNLDEPERHSVLRFLNALPIFEEVELNGNNFFLSHTVPEKQKFNDFEQCRMTDFIIGEPEYEEVYDNGKIIVTGHTPTGFIDKNSTGKIWKGNNHIAIDCGAVFGNPLGCICLDTMKEIYME